MTSYQVMNEDRSIVRLVPAALSSFDARKLVAAETGKHALEFIAIPCEIRTASIPFAGFYCSSHDALTDSTLESMFSDDSGEPIAALVERAWNLIDWRIVHLAYAQHYSDRLADECNANWQFAKLDSPREYNFRSDEIDVTITLDELRRMLEYVEPDALQSLATDRLTARDGFIPLYPADVQQWGDIDQWDAPLLSLLIECYCDEYSPSDERDWNLVEDCNGEVTAMIESAMPADALQALYAECDAALT